MAITTTISQKELKRIAGLAYEGKTLKVLLASVGSSGFGAESTVANWQSVEVSGNGYARFSQVIAAGSYDATDGRYEIPDINAAFTASSNGVGFSYDRIILYIDGETYIYSMLVENPNVVLAPGQTQTYRLSIATND